MAYVPGQLQAPELEVKSIRQGDLDLRLLLCRTHKHARVLDYRVGNYIEKRDILDTLAETEGLRKVFTVVEKSDGQSWRAVGFSREGCIPGFFRTADGYVLTRIYEEGAAMAGGAPKPPKPAAEKTAARRRFRKPEGATVEVVKDALRLSQVFNHSLTDYRIAPLGGTSFQPELAVRVKVRRHQFWITAEMDESFGHARVDLASPGRGTMEQHAVGHGLTVLCAELEQRGIGSVFGVCTQDDKFATEVYTGLGFKITARLADHMAAETDFQHANVYHKRIGPTR